MINAEKAYKKMASASETPIAMMVDYGDAYVFGFKNNDRNAANTTYKAVIKKDGKVVNFIVDNFNKFFDAVENKSIDFSKFNNGEIAHGIFSGNGWRIKR